MHSIQVSREERQQELLQKAVVLWIRNSDSEKASTLAHYIERRLFSAGILSSIIDGKQLSKNNIDQMSLLINQLLNTAIIVITCNQGISLSEATQICTDSDLVGIYDENDPVSTSQAILFNSTLAMEQIADDIFKKLSPFIMV